MTKELDFNDIKRAIISSLTPDLLEKKYREQLTPDDPIETGHCAVASEAFYHLAGGKEAGFIPIVAGYAADGKGNMKFGHEREEAIRQGWRKESHWWIKGPKGDKRGEGKLFDVTVGQFPEPFPYEKGHNTGFMQPKQIPSKRAQIVIDRVVKKLGKPTLEAYKRHNIASFKAEASSNRPKHRSHRAIHNPRT